MRRSETAVRYAQALFGIAEKKGNLEAVSQELEAFSAAVAKNPVVLKLVNNSAISTDSKEQFLEKILNGKTSTLVLHFLKVLLHKKRLADLASIQLEFQRLVEEQQGIKEVRVISAVELSELFKNRLSVHLSKALGAKIRMLSEVRPKILGGLILRFGHHQYNASFRHRLETIRQRLLAS